MEVVQGIYGDISWTKTGGDIMVKTTDKTGTSDEVTVKHTDTDIAKKDESKLLRPFEEMDRIFENLFARGWMRPSNWDLSALDDIRMPFSGKIPRIDVVDRSKEVVIRAEIPGVDKKDLDVTMTDTAVTVKGSTRIEKKDEREDYYRSEISKGSFSRTVALPDNVDAEKAKASFTDGLLEITVPKLRESVRHNIKVD
jgi:HSP20 family protein